MNYIDITRYLHIYMLESPYYLNINYYERFNFKDYY